MFSMQGLLPGLLGYLIQFAPLAFIPHCRLCYCNVPSPLLVYLRLTYFTITSDILVTSPSP